jgi:hypothetical protein
MQKVILTMTTIPNRLGDPRPDFGLRPVLKHLLSIRYPNFELHLNIPYHNKKTNEEYVIPDWLNDIKDQRLKVFRTEDYGSITKIAPTLLRVTDPNAVIITVDDDLLYESGFIEYHLYKRKQYPNAVLGFSGLDPVGDSSIRFCTSVAKDIRVKIIEGYKTVSYLRKFFDEDFFTDFIGTHWADDIILSAYMGKQNIEKIVMKYDGDTDYTPRVESFPVIGHAPCEAGGCNLFRAERQEADEAKEQEFYDLGYLER